MAMTVQQLRNSMRLVPTDAVMAARIPDGPGARSEKLARVGHHNRAEGDVDENQPVEIFTDPLSAGGVDLPDMSAAQLSEALARFPGTSLVRVAVPMPKEDADDAGHHRILDVETIGFGTAEGDAIPPVELHCERWDSLSVVIRRDDHKIGEAFGDAVYARDAEVDAEGNRVERGPVRMTVAGASEV